MEVRRALGLATVLLVLPGAALERAAGTTPVPLLVLVAAWATAATVVAVAAPGAGLGPADRVTLARLALTCVCAGLVAAGRPGVPLLTGVAVVALLLDAVDGRVARRTGTVSAFGGRFDGEADALLMLVLSVAVVPRAGAWVLGIGLVRYAFGAAAWPLPWLRARLPGRWWRKVVTAVSGIALVAAVPGVLPAPVVLAGLLLASGLLAESFGRDVWWLWRRRTVRAPAPVVAGARP